MENIEEQQSACLSVGNVKGLVTVLHAIKPANNKTQECVVLIGPDDGLTVRLEDDSKGLQSSVFMRPDLFDEVDCPGGRQLFGLQFSLLLDTLQLFATKPGQQLCLRYPNADQQLVIEMRDVDSDDSICTYARISTTEMQIPRDHLEFWQEPSTFFIVSGQLLKEAVEDLEWACSSGHQAARGNVHLLIRDSPRTIQLRATGAGSLQIDLPVDDGEVLHGFSCDAEEVTCSFKHKHLRAAFCNLPHNQKDASNVSTKVSIDSQGLMKVTHMIGVQTGSSAATQRAGVYPSQASLDKKAVVHFVLLPEEDCVSE